MLIIVSIIYLLSWTIGYNSKTTSLLKLSMLSLRTQDIFILHWILQVCGPVKHQLSQLIVGTLVLKSSYMSILSTNRWVVTLTCFWSRSCSRRWVMLRDSRPLSMQFKRTPRIRTSSLTCWDTVSCSISFCWKFKSFSPEEAIWPL